MKQFIAILSACALIIPYCGCEPARDQSALLLLDATQNQTVSYHMVSERSVTVDFDPSGKASKGRKSKPQDMTEKLDINATFAFKGTDENGYIILDITYDSVNATRTTLSGRSKGANDPVEKARGKTVRFKLTPGGRIVDDSDFRKLLTDLGDSAFSGTRGGNRIKDPDMIMDLTALQWFMWDALASLDQTIAKAKTGKTWDSLLPVPMQVPLNAGRDTTYKLTEITVDQQGSPANAIISSTYELKKKRPDMPMPYTGGYQMRGLFGFLRGYKAISLDGQGTQVIDLQRGLITKIDQQYQAGLEAAMLFPLGAGDAEPEPNMIINQKLSISLME